MNELTELARAELERLGKQEIQVRAAMRAQKAKLQELIRQLPAPINRLPNELLLRMFEFSIQSSDNILKLGKVSRRWRDVILQCPSLWSIIRVTQQRRMLLLEAQVARSAELPLKIGICEIYDEELLNAILDILIPCAVRWRSLVIQGNVFRLCSALTRLNYHEYPSLTHVSIQNKGPRFTGISHFYSRQCPRLEYLELGSYSFQVPHSVTSLSLHLTSMELRLIVQDSSLQELTSLQKLTSLSISKWEGDVKLTPNSIHLLLLEKLVCDGKGELNGLLQAIVAPELIDLQHESPLRDRVDGDIFTKFPNITRLVLSRVEHFSYSGAVAFRFPAIRHVDVGYLRAANSLFASDTGPDTTLHLPRLESLTVRLLCPECDGVLLHSLVAWLKARQSMDLPRLLIRLGFSNSSGHQGHHRGRTRGKFVCGLYVRLHEYCRLEWIDVPLIGTVDDLLQLVCALQFAMSKLSLFWLYRRCQMTLGSTQDTM